MDSGTWIHGYAGNNGYMCGYAAANSCTPADLQFMEQEQQQFLISSQIQHHLNQISMRMNMDDEVAEVYVPSEDAAMGMNNGSSIADCLLDQQHRAAGSFVPSSSSSSTLSRPSVSLSCSPESSAHVHAAAPGSSNQYLQEVSSHVPLPPATVVAHPYDYDQQYTGNLHVPAVAPPPTSQHGAAAAMAQETKPGAFKHYARHLGPKRPPKPGACGQRMFKTAISVLSKMHAAVRYSQQQQQQQQQQQYYYHAAAAAEPVPPPSVNQLQHMFSERKRREKLNDSFHALKAVLPPGAKKDKTSILIRAREYVRSLEAKVSELQEMNKSLESRLARGDSSHVGRKDTSSGSGGGSSDDDDKVHIEITRAASSDQDAQDLCTLKIAARSPCNMTTEVVLRTLQCLKDQMGDDVSLVAMSTSGGANGAAPGSNTSPRAALTLQIKSSPGARWEEQPVKDAVAKVVADALTLPAASAAAPRR